jgi:hypothetical protein
MPIKFVPVGNLNIAADPSILPSQAQGKMEVSGAMTRCTNLDIDDIGTAKTRDGSSKVNAVAMDETDGHLLMEMNGSRYAFSGTKIYENESSIATGLTSAKWRGVQANAFNVTTQSIFALNGTDRKRIEGSNVYEWGLTAPTTAPTLTGIDYVYTNRSWEADQVTGATKQLTVDKEINGEDYNIVYPWEEAYDADPAYDVLVTNPNISSSDTSYESFHFENSDIGAIQVKYTYVRKSGTTLEAESDPSSATNINIESGIKVTWVASSDSDVTHVRIYRTLAGGSTFYYDSEHAVGDLSVALTTADADLGSIVETDHDRPPLGTVVEGPAYNGYLFILKDNRLYFCKNLRPEYWPPTYYIEVGPAQFDLKAIRFHNGMAYVMNQYEIYEIQGSTNDTFFPYPMSASTGALSQEATESVKNRGIYHVSRDGIWLFNGSNDKKITESEFDPIFRGETKGSIPAIQNVSECWLFEYRDKLYFGFPDTSDGYSNNLLVTNLETDRTVHYDYGETFKSINIDRTNNRIIALDNSGYIWEIQDSDSTDDDGTAISWQIESKAYSDQLYKYFPRYAKYDVDVGSGATATGTVLLNDTSHQTHSITGSRKTKKRLITSGTGDRIGVRINGTGTVTFREAEVE